jgi:hypothetical protein
MSPIIQLYSNFCDCYDPAPIPGANYIWTRLSYDTIFQRDDQLGLLNRIGVPTVKWGLLSADTFAEVLKLNQQYRLVVYYDPSAHGGLGKGLVDQGGLKALKPGLDQGGILIYSVFIETTSSPLLHSQSYRYLRVGDQDPILLHYQNESDWRAHQASYRNVKIIERNEIGSEILTMIELLKDPVLMRFPLVAIDFLVDSDGGIHAIEIDTAPVLAGLGLSDPWASISRLVTTNLDTMLEFLVKAVTLPPAVYENPHWELTASNQLVHIPYGTYLKRVSDGSTWIHDYNSGSPKDSFLAAGSNKFTSAQTFFESNPYKLL